MSQMKLYRSGKLAEERGNQEKLLFVGAGLHRAGRHNKPLRRP
jgi:hypothetical protein